MTKFEENLLKFNEYLYEQDLEYVGELTNNFFKELCHHIHIEPMIINIIEDEANYLYRHDGDKFFVNFRLIKMFQKFAHLFLLDTLFIVARVLMQKNFKNTLTERESLGGKFFVVQDNANLPMKYADIFALDNTMLLYAEIEKDKNDFHSVTLFDRRAFAYACMEEYIKLINLEGGKDFLNYLQEDFVTSKEDAKPETPLELEDNIIKKYKSENQLGFLEEMELRELIYKQIENVLGE